MFQGFNESTVKYYEAIKKENSKRMHQENEMLYLEGVKYPLEELYFEMFNYFHTFDADLLGNKRRCISPAYNDARFCREEPIKEYFYIRFKLDMPNKKNALGFFLDASLDGYRYGLNIYKPDAKGMEKIRDYLLDNKHYAIEVIRKFNESHLLEMQGETYKRASFPEENPVLQEWLEHKRMAFVRETPLDADFFSRKLWDDMCKAFDSVRDVYLMLEEALQ